MGFWERSSFWSQVANRRPTRAGADIRADQPFGRRAGSKIPFQWNNFGSSQFTVSARGYVDAAERAIAAIRHQSKLSPEIVEALQETLGAIRSVDRGLATLEGISSFAADGSATYHDG